MEPKICPYLGLSDDPKAYKEFPYEGNACYRARRSVPIALSHQRGYCLTDEHTTCPGYLNGWVNGFPDSLKAFPPTYKRILRNKLVWAALAVVLLISIYLIFNQQITTVAHNLGLAVSSRDALPTSTAALQSTSSPTRTPIPPTHTASPKPTDAATSTRAFTDTPSPTLTATPTVISGQATETQPYLVKVNTRALNIRSEPIYKADGSNIVARLVQGDIVEVFEEQKGWLRTERGWIFKAYTSKVLD